MTPAISGHDLLRALRSGAASGATSNAAPAPASGADSLDFDALLKRVRAEGFKSGLGVTVAPEAGLELSSDQLRRLSAAADVAQAHGSNRALVMIDGMSLVLDVNVRTITGRAAIEPGKPLTGFDSILQVPDVGTPTTVSAGAQAGAIPTAAGSALSRSLPLKNSSLLAALAKDTDAA